MRRLGSLRWEYLDWRLLVAGSAVMLAALYLMRPETFSSPDGSAVIVGLHEPTTPLEAPLFLIGWLLFWSALRVFGAIGWRVLIGLLLYVLTGIAVVGITPYTPLWSPPGFRRDVLDRLAAWLSWPQFV